MGRGSPRRRPHFDLRQEASQLRHQLDESKAASGKHSVDSLCLMRRLVHVLAAQEEALGEAASVQRSLIGTLELLDPLPALALAGSLLDLAALVLREGKTGAAGAAITRCLDLLEDEVVGPSEASNDPGTVDAALGAADAESVRVRAYGLRASVHARCAAVAAPSHAPPPSHRRPLRQVTRRGGHSRGLPAPAGGPGRWGPAVR